jgi:aspartate-semialdehyde dehydrogenase
MEKRMPLRVAVVGATGVVGKEMLAILAERQFPATEVVALASRRSMGHEVSYGDKTLKVKNLDGFDFGACDLALLSAGGDVSREWAPKIAATGCIVIDNSSAFRMDPDVPLIVPEVNADAVDGMKKNIIANPNCSTAALVVALKPIHDAAGVKRCVVSTYQATSGAGKEAMDELWTQTKAIYVNDSIVKEQFPKQIAFNVIPFIGSFRDDGFTDEEAKMWNETHKMIDSNIKLTVTCVRVPVFVGHSLSVNVELERPLMPGEARALLRESPGLMVVDKRDTDDGYITPVECVGEFATFVSRIRRDTTVENGLSFWVVSDNLRKGAALNTVQIAELLLNRGRLKAAA